MKKILFSAAWVCLCTNLFAAEIYVSPAGKDTHDGTKATPKATLHSAFREARELRRLEKIATNEPIYIYLHGGTYTLYEPLFIRPEDTGSKESPTVVAAIKGEEPIISSGVPVTGWKRVGKYWVATVPSFNGNPLTFRQLWVNGVKADRARDVADFNDMSRIRSNDKVNQLLWVPASAVKKVLQAPNLELVLHQMWAISNLRVQSITIQGDSAGIRFHNPEARLQFERPWPQPMVKEGVNSPFYLTNALELLDQPGEWFHNQQTNTLYYLPRAGEQMQTATCIIPTLETLIDVNGTLDNPIKHITFQGITFNYTTWTRPSEKGHVPLQAGMYLIDAYKLRPPGAPGNFNKGIDNQGWIGRPPGAISVQGAKHIEFDACRFEHIGSCAIDLLPGTQYDVITGCLFKDIAGNGIQVGTFSAIGTETHLPYNPEDRRNISNHQTIANNYFTDVTNEDWGCVAICAGFVRNIRIEHNEICNVSYTGISLGWGWTKTVNSMQDNLVHANYVHHFGKHVYDVAGIYTLSVQTKSTISENRVDSIYSPKYVHDPAHWFYLYTDEGSSFITVKDNWCPEEKFLQNANGPGNTWTNNGSMVSPEIKNRAGLEPAYHHLRTR